MKNLNIGVVGATGIVGETFLSLLAERKFPTAEIRLFASDSSAGKTIDFAGCNITLQKLEEDCFNNLDLVFFSSGDNISKEWAPKAVTAGAFAVDNSAAFRLNPEIPLIVPEANAEKLPSRNKPQIIANPNCSTIQLVVALAPLNKKFGLKDVKVSTYQSASGAGREAISELKAQFAQASKGETLQHQIFSAPLVANCIPQIGSIADDGFSTEERKLIFETRKILDMPDLSISSFAVRVPTMIGHGESVWLTLGETISKEDFTKCLADSPGLSLQENPLPMVQAAAGTDPVYVGRVHRDLNCDKTWILWIVADNVRKGAALNGVQIAEAIFDIKPRP